MVFGELHKNTCWYPGAGVHTHVVTCLPTIGVFEATEGHSIPFLRPNNTHTVEGDFSGEEIIRNESGDKGVAQRGTEVNCPGLRCCKSWSPSPPRNSQHGWSSRARPPPAAPCPRWGACNRARRWRRTVPSSKRRFVWLKGREVFIFPLGLGPQRNV